VNLSYSLFYPVSEPTLVRQNVDQIDNTLAKIDLTYVQQIDGGIVSSRKTTTGLKSKPTSREPLQRAKSAILELPLTWPRQTTIGDNWRTITLDDTGRTHRDPDVPILEAQIAASKMERPFERRG
jgi:hypothetical protein